MSITVPAPDPTLAVGIDCPLRVLDLDGSRLPNELLDPFLTDIDESALTNLYVDMVRVRRLDTEAFALTRQGHLVLWPPLLGQEAAQVGPARAAATARARPLDRRARTPARPRGSRAAARPRRRCAAGRRGSP